MTLWIHQASSTFRRDEPANLLQTVSTADPEWGFHSSRDQWVPTERSDRELRDAGFTELGAPDDPDVVWCPHCRTIMQGLPGSVTQKHLRACDGGGEDWLYMEATVLADVRLKKYEATLLADAKRDKEERDAQTKKERFDRMKDEVQKQQMGKDRKRRIREETKKELRKR